MQNQSSNDVVLSRRIPCELHVGPEQLLRLWGLSLAIIISLKVKLRYNL